MTGRTWTKREKRKTARLPGRFDVLIRERLATWAAATEDVSPRGCCILVKRPLLRLGALVELAFELGPSDDPLVVHGQVAWVRRVPPLAMAGVMFLTSPRQLRMEPVPQAPPRVSRPPRWFDRLPASSGG